MAEARSKHDWGRTSSLLALIANVNRDPKRQSRPFTPDQFNPHAVRRRKPKGRPFDVGRFADDLMRISGQESRKRI